MLSSVTCRGVREWLEWQLQTQAWGCFPHPSFSLVEFPKKYLVPPLWVMVEPNDYFLLSSTWLKGWVTSVLTFAVLMCVLVCSYFFSLPCSCKKPGGITEQPPAKTHLARSERSIWSILKTAGLSSTYPHTAELSQDSSLMVSLWEMDHVSKPCSMESWDSWPTAQVNKPTG